MLIVLLIVSVLILLFLPNLSAQRTTIDRQGNQAVVKVVETQIELYRLENGQDPSRDDLISRNYVTEEQYKIYEENR